MPVPGAAWVGKFLSHRRIAQQQGSGTEGEHETVGVMAGKPIHQMEPALSAKWPCNQRTASACFSVMALTTVPPKAPALSGVRHPLKCR